MRFRPLSVCLTLLLGSLACASPARAQQHELDYSAWAVDATKPGAQLPPTGRSLFDYLVTEKVGAKREYRVPFPFSALVERVQRELGQTEYGGGTRIAMLPMGRSLQRVAAAPDFFKYPRLVFAVTGEPAVSDKHSGMFLKDKLYVGYVEITDTLEVISYNEAAGRFEFQLVKDYRAGAQPKVYYANRAICISCHQNHAPIFSKAVWSETNANGRIAELLGQSRADFYDLPPQANIDFPDDIGQATVRANTLVTQQSLWQRACESEDNRDAARRCRAAALVAVMQYALSGERDFGAGSPRYQSDFVTTFGANWRTRWPQGLNVAQAELPDRSPFGTSGATYGGGGPAPVVTDLLAAAHVPAALDPLNPRAPREVWRFAGALETHRYIVGWSRFFAAADFQQLDAHLLQRARETRTAHTQFEAKCTLAPNVHATYTLKLDCDDGKLALRAQIAANGSGQVEWLNLLGTGQVRDAWLLAEEPKRVGKHYVAHAALQRKGLTGRLPDGRAITEVSLRWPVKSGANLKRAAAVQLSVRTADDFALLRTAVDRLLSKQPALFDSQALQRAALLPALYGELGMGAREWCCIDTNGMPAAQLEPMVTPTNIAEELQPLYHNCATCHVSAEHFPPNFLAGDAERVSQNLKQCAPRLYARLSAWRQPAEQRNKSPMPPATFLPALGTNPHDWVASDEFTVLERQLQELLQAQGRPTQLEELLKNGYEALPSCLLGTAHHAVAN